MTNRVEVLVKEDGEKIRRTAFNVEDEQEAPSEDELKEFVEDAYRTEGDEDRDYFCDECGEEFESQNALAGHMASH